MEMLVNSWLETNFNIKLPLKKIELLDKYMQLVLEANKYVNLTAITNTRDFIVKHIIDSLTLIPHIPQDCELIDVGTGAGFPGVVVKLARDDIKLFLMDARKKRINFLAEALNKINIDAETVHARSEEWAKTNTRRFGCCTVRAVGKLDKLACFTLPILKKTGILLAMKGPDVKTEIRESAYALKKFGGEIVDIKTYDIDEGLKRNIIVIKKS